MGEKWASRQQRIVNPPMWMEDSYLMMIIIATTLRLATNDGTPNRSQILCQIYPHPRKVAILLIITLRLWEVKLPPLGHIHRSSEWKLNFSPYLSDLKSLRVPSASHIKYYWVTVCLLSDIILTDVEYVTIIDFPFSYIKSLFCWIHISMLEVGS